jgi:hypothetical protein
MARGGVTMATAVAAVPGTGSVRMSSARAASVPMVSEPAECHNAETGGT